MKILITGATGMLGRNILDVLLTESYDVFCPSRKDLNLFNEEAICKYLEKIAPDLIIHCAGKVGGIQANVNDPLGFFLENLEMGKNLILAAYKIGIRNFLNMGSSCMYPRNVQNPLRESQILTGELEPTNEGYALAKVTIQRLCSYITNKNPLFRYVTLIPCNLYGIYDKFDPIQAHLIPAAIQKIHSAKKNHESKVSIWGDGTARREFLYAGDAADFIVKNIHCFHEWPLLMNLSAINDRSITEYYEIIKSVIGYSGVFHYDLSKPVGMKQKLLDPHAQTLLNWSPITSLEEGIEKTYRYFLKSGYA